MKIVDCRGMARHAPTVREILIVRKLIMKRKYETIADNALDMTARKNDFEIEAADDPDEYDDTGEANDPNSPIWDDSSVQNSFYGNDPFFPDSNEITQD